MRFSYFLTLLFLLPALLLLSCTAEEPDTGDNPTYGITDADFDSPSKSPVIEHSEPEVEQPPAHLSIAREYVGVVEVRKNTGPEIDRFLENVGLQSGLNYCAAFVSYCLDRAEEVVYPETRSGVAQHFIDDHSIDARRVLRAVQTVPKGAIAVWKRGNTWQGHAGFVRAEWTGAEGYTIEANTTPGPLGDQRQGQGVYKRQRVIQPANYFRITHFTEVRYQKKLPR